MMTIDYEEYRFRTLELETRFRIELITKIRDLDVRFEPFVLRTRRIGY